LVELIVVITILAILWTIAFLSFQWYSTSARDGVRISDMNNINKLLSIHQLKWWKYPQPDDYITISASWIIIWYQWVIWTNASRIINTNKIIIDPLDNIPYTYYTNKTHTSYQLLWYIEWNTITERIYSKRYPKVLWNVLWILLDTSNNPIKTDIDLFNAQTWILFKSFVSNTTVKTLSWVELGWPLLSLSNSLNFWFPKICPEWFIKVQWSEEFMQPWFCVAKYEMSYMDMNIPNSWWPIPATPDWNTVAYTWAKIPVSMSWKYPIADIKQQEAIDACKSMWEWYHLITNNEWMTIARDIEANYVNWSWKAVWSWYIYTWLSNSSMWCLWGTKTIYTLARYRGAKTWEWNTWTWVTTCDPYRKHTLSNWEIIWDFAGNLWEHVNKLNTIDWTYFDLWKTSIIWSSDWTSWDNDWILVPNNDMKKYWSNLWLWITNGMWNFQKADWVDNNVFVRWAHAAWADRTGIYSLRLARNETSFDDYVWFRCAK
jgi:type II secretory pathway pseudopilin PulG